MSRSIDLERRIIDTVVSFSFTTTPQLSAAVRRYTYIHIFLLIHLSKWRRPYVLISCSGFYGGTGRPVLSALLGLGIVCLDWVGLG